MNDKLELVDVFIFERAKLQFVAQDVDTACWIFNRQLSKNS